MHCKVDLKDVSEDGKTVSKDDILFLNKLNEGIRKNGHGHMKWSCPLRKDDNGVTIIESKEEAVQLVQEARELCAMGGLQLHKFISNDRAVLKSIPPSEYATDIKNLDLTFDDLTVE